MLLWITAYLEFTRWYQSCSFIRMLYHRFLGLGSWFGQRWTSSWKGFWLLAIWHGTFFIFLFLFFLMLFLQRLWCAEYRCCFALIAFLIKSHFSICIKRGKLVFIILSMKSCKRIGILTLLVFLFLDSIASALRCKYWFDLPGSGLILLKLLSIINKALIIPLGRSSAHNH